MPEKPLNWQARGGAFAALSAPRFTSYTPAMPDTVAFPLMGLIAAGLVALALVWPQGEGAPSPKPFGHPLAAAAGQTSPAPAIAVQAYLPGAGRAAAMSPSANRGVAP